jgi:DNA adenine methylase
MLSAPLKWHGGKSYLATWIHNWAPVSAPQVGASGYTHRNIVFGGGLAEFWNWQPIEGISETVNDSNGELINFWTVLRDEEYFSEFQRLAEATPFSDVLFERAGDGEPFSGEFVARAHRFFVRYRQSRQGLGRDFSTPTRRTRRGMNEQVSAWLTAVEGLAECHARLKRVEIRCMDFRKFIPMYDHERALFYCDPPYPHDTRVSIGEYGEHEMVIKHHEDLLEILAGIKGKFMLSGYHNALYSSFRQKYGWRCIEKIIDNKASSQSVKPKKTECLWLNY